MLKLARLSRPFAALPLLAALASTAPLVRWCPLPWSEVSVEDFVACGSVARECARRCEDTTPPPPCAGPCPVRPATEDGRAYCLEAPAAATQGPGSPAIDPPAALAGVLADDAVPEPACAGDRPLAFEPARPRSRPPGLPPPVRGPPCVA